MNFYTCPKCGQPYDAGLSFAKRHTCKKQQQAASQQSAAAWGKSIGWREGHGFAGARRPSRDDQRDKRIFAAWVVLAVLETAASLLAGTRVRRRNDWIKAARQPRAGGFGAGGDGGRSGN
ncbi:hypothetical protein [Streptomyces nigra]|uniref:hypothetical protein n=1 Tax=Streptomyces nigra TaxID=1827580 RepID=UPI0034331BE9